MTTPRPYDQGGSRGGPLGLVGALLILAGSLAGVFPLILLGLALLVPAVVFALFHPAAPVERPVRPWERDREPQP